MTNDQRAEFDYYAVTCIALVIFQMFRYLKKLNTASIWMLAV